MTPDSSLARLERRRLGPDGPVVSRIGLGLAALGRPGYMTAGHAADLDGDTSVDGMRHRAHSVLDAAFASGIRYFDAARSYGRAEEFLASWLSGRALSRDDVTIGSKWGYRYTADWRTDADVHEIKDHSLAALRTQWEESRVRLGAHLSLYQIHSATPDSGVLDDTAVLDRLARVRDAGVRIGLSLSGARQAHALERAMEIVRDGVRLFTCVQATWNVLEPSAGPMLAAAHVAGMGVIVKEVLATGHLAKPDASDGDHASALRTLAGIARRLDASVDAVAIAAALAQPWADCVLSGAARTDHLRSNLAASMLVLPLPLREELAALAVPADEYWRIRSANPWT